MKNKKYPYELKKQVVELYYEGESAINLTERFDLSNRRRVYEWTTIVREHGYSALEYGIPKERDTGEGEADETILRKEVSRLKLENEYLKKLLDLKRG